MFRARGNFQAFDVARRFVGNRAKFEVFGEAGEIIVNGSVAIEEQGRTKDGAVASSRIKAVFESFELRWGRNVRLALPLTWLNPTGFVDTLYLDKAMRISVGDKGSVFVALKVRE